MSPPGPGGDRAQQAEGRGWPRDPEISGSRKLEPGGPRATSSQESLEMRDAQVGLLVECGSGA